MKEIEKLLLAGTMIAGAVALGAGAAGATSLPAVRADVTQPAPVIRLAQAHAAGGAQDEDKKAARDDHDRRPGKRDADEAGKRKADKADHQAADRDRGKAKPARAAADERHQDAQDKRADQKKAAQDKRADQKKAAQDKRADQKKAAQDKRADQKEAAQEKRADQKESAQDKRADQKGAAQGKQAEQDKQAEQNKRAADDKADRRQDARDDRRDARDDHGDHRAGRADDRRDNRRDAQNDRDHDQRNARGDHDRDRRDAQRDYDHDSRNAHDDHDHDRRNARDDHDHDRRNARDDRDHRGDHDRNETRVRNRTVIHVDGRVIVRHDDIDRLRRHARDVKVVNRPDGTRVTTVIRPDGSRIVTVEDSRGRLIRRSREVNGRDIVLFRNEHPDVVVAAPIALPPLRLTIPRDRYVVEADRAPEAMIIDTLSAPPVETVERRYDLNEVLQNRRLREKLRRIDLTAITFATGSSDIPANEVDDLKQIAQALKQLIRKNPDEVFLIAGHTDAVGAPEDNLVLSDERAESVASVLTGSFNVPAANLVTQGYGEQFLKIQTDGPEQANRRVTIRRITPLLQQSARR